MSPAKNCTGLTLAEDSLREATHLSAEGGLEDEIILFLSAPGCAWLTGPNNLMGLKV